MLAERRVPSRTWTETSNARRIGGSDWPMTSAAHVATPHDLQERFKVNIEIENDSEFKGEFKIDVAIPAQPDELVKVSANDTTPNFFFTPIRTKDGT